MKNITLKLLVSTVALLLFAADVHSQSNCGDCIIYEKVLSYINDEASKPWIGYAGISDPINPSFDSTSYNRGYQYNFYIVKKKSDFSNRSVIPWFSRLVKDSTLNQYSYKSDCESTMNCNFSNEISYQYCDFENIPEFTEKHFIKKISGADTNSFIPMRITFSKVLHTKKSRLVYAKIFMGLGSGQDILVYGFVFKKEDKDWIIDKAEKEVR